MRRNEGKLHSSKTLLQTYWDSGNWRFCAVRFMLKFLLSPIYNEDLLQVMQHIQHSTVFTYADDTSLCYQGPKIIQVDDIINNTPNDDGYGLWENLLFY